MCTQFLFNSKISFYDGNIVEYPTLAVFEVFQIWNTLLIQIAFMEEYTATVGKCTVLLSITSPGQRQRFVFDILFDRYKKGVYLFIIMVVLSLRSM